MRKSKDEYFLDMAQAAAGLATCDRLHVGCVMVLDGAVVSTGYNGSVRGLDHCCDVGCIVVDNHCIVTVHAEINAICSAARLGHKLDGATSYQNYFPCYNCFKTMANAGIKRIVFSKYYGGADSYSSKQVKDEAVKAGILLEHHSKTKEK